MRGSGEAWCDAEIAGGADPDDGRTAVGRRRSPFYTGGLMHAFDVLGDPVRRRILELLADGELTSGVDHGDVIRDEFGISQPAVSQHLRVLRENGFATVRADGARRLYALDAGRSAASTSGSTSSAGSGSSASTPSAPRSPAAAEGPRRGGPRAR